MQEEVRLVSSLGISVQYYDSVGIRHHMVIFLSVWVRLVLRTLKLLCYYEAMMNVHKIHYTYICQSPISLTTHTATPELPEIRNAYHSVLVFLLLSVDMFLSLCGFIEC